MRIFIIVWLGQFVSLFGSRLTEFALAVWVFQKTASITQFALIFLLFYLPNIIISPLTGILIDRWNRRYCMILSDLIAGITSFVIMVLVVQQQLEVWHIYLAIIILSLVNGLQLPAYTTSIAQLVDKENLTRANGMVQVATAIVKIITPAIAGFLSGIIHLKGILLIDLSTFIFAMITLFRVRFPKFKPAKSKKIRFSNLLKETLFSWNYIARRSNLVKLLIFVAITYFTFSMSEVLFWAFILSFSSSKELGLLLSIGGCGMLLGSLLITIRKGLILRIQGILFSVQLQGILLIMFSLKTSIVTAAVGIFGYLFVQPIIVSCNLSIWQSKIPFNLQGRVFALQQILERSLAIFAYLIIGPLVDYLFEPLIGSNLGETTSVDSGQGLGLLISLIGIVNIVATLFAYGDVHLRRLEKELPDAN